ncbi:MAG: hypothetical protein DMF89_25500 [Acidobacteria bacterium]|nr:MAG: hypothetical protein DMF90_06305 [Acidobacteriota bacterium]PYR45267.1 MAG: hypothetical protein DMF89_25500 [Acidobacteriota bacterium]
MLQKLAERLGFWRANLITLLLFLAIHLPGWIAFSSGLPFSPTARTTFCPSSSSAGDSCAPIEKPTRASVVASDAIHPSWRVTRANLPNAQQARPAKTAIWTRCIQNHTSVPTSPTSRRSGS